MSAPDRALSWAERQLGWRPTHVAAVPGTHGASHVTRLQAGPARIAFLKRHGQVRKHRQERDALGHWAPRVDGTPRLVAAHDDPPLALLLTAVPGRAVGAAPSSPDQAAQVHRAAGRWLRAWHALPFLDDDPVRPLVALRARWDRWQTRAACLLPHTTRAWVGDLLVTLEPPPDRVPCHRDFTPHNWMWHEEHGLAVVDFEHARADLAWVDVVCLIDGPWLARPDLEEAFWDGYGKRPDDASSGLLVALRALRALGTIAWGAAHRDGAFEAAGRRVLRRLRAPGT